MRKTAILSPSAKLKALLALDEFETRRDPTSELFAELNKTVFGNGLPESTQLIWSNRLLSTAGRARWRRSKDGVQSTEIELATKILDSEGKVAVRFKVCET